MTRKSSIGALHPILFFVLIYGISLFMALFVCRAVYYSINGGNEVVKTENASEGLSYAGSVLSARGMVLR